MTTMDICMNALGQFIATEIVRSKLTDAAFARHCGIDPSTLSQWMSDDPPSEPSFKLLTRLAKGTGKDLCAIVALVEPELAHTNAKLILVNQALADLNPDELDRVDDFLTALHLKKSNKG